MQDMQNFFGLLCNQVKNFFLPSCCYTYCQRYCNGQIFKNYTVKLCLQISKEYKDQVIKEKYVTFYTFKYMPPKKFSFFLAVVLKRHMTSARQKPDVYRNIMKGIPHFCGLRSSLLQNSPHEEYLQWVKMGTLVTEKNWELMCHHWVSVLSHPSEGITLTASLQTEKTY